MSLKTYPLTLTASEQDVLEIPYGVQGTAHGILVTGSGNLTLKYYSARNSQTYTIHSGLSITDEKTLDKAFDLEPGDRLIAAGDGLSIFASVYEIGTEGGTEKPALGPGPQTLQSGDMQAGFFGEVSSSELFSGDELAYLLGVTEGVPQFSDAGWLKFAHRGEVKYIAKQTLRHSISWDHLYERGIVYGVDGDGAYPRGTPTNQYTTVERGANRFICRLMTGANADPIDESDERFFEDGMCELNMGGGSEWNELIYRIHQLEPDCPATNHRADGSGGPQEGDNWATFTDSELRVGSGNGRQTWCQERGESSSSRVIRGVSDVASFRRTAASSTNSSRGWRPALVLIPNN